MNSPVLNEYDSHKYEKNQVMVKKPNTLGFICEKLGAF